MDCTEPQELAPRDSFAAPFAYAASSNAHFIPFAFPGVPFVKCAFSTALAGSMGMGYAGATAESDASAAHNRKRLLDECGLERWVELKQVHKDDMQADPEATALNENSSLEGDGSCTQERGLALAIKTADCQPILLTDKAGTAIAALHSGWRGNAMNFPAAGVHFFCEQYGLSPKDVLAVRGPSLGPAAAQFVNFEKEWPAEFKPWFNEKERTMDLWSLARAQLLGAGLLPGNIYSLDLCTWSLSGLFFSHRRGHTGRMASLVWIE